jgi:hypothetical protein
MDKTYPREMTQLNIMPSMGGELRSRGGRMPLIWCDAKENMQYHLAFIKLYRSIVSYTVIHHSITKFEVGQFYNPCLL